MSRLRRAEGRVSIRLELAIGSRSVSEPEKELQDRRAALLSLTEETWLLPDEAMD